MDGGATSLLPSPPLCITKFECWKLGSMIYVSCLDCTATSATSTLWLDGQSIHRSQERPFMQWILCIGGMPITYNPEWERRKGSLGSSIEEREGRRKRREEDWWNFAFEWTSNRHTLPDPSFSSSSSAQKSKAYVERRTWKRQRGKNIQINFSHFPSWNWMANSIQSFLDDWAAATEGNRKCPASTVSRIKWVWGTL